MHRTIHPNRQTKTCDRPDQIIDDIDCRANHEFEVILFAVYNRDKTFRNFTIRVMWLPEKEPWQFIKFKPQPGIGLDSLKDRAIKRYAQILENVNILIE